MVTSGVAEAESTECVCSGSIPATPRERSICEDVVNATARLEDRAVKECGWSIPRISFLSMDRGHSKTQQPGPKRLFSGQKEKERPSWKCLEILT